MAHTPGRTQACRWPSWSPCPERQEPTWIAQYPEPNPS